MCLTTQIILATRNTLAISPIGKCGTFASGPGVAGIQEPLPYETNRPRRTHSRPEVRNEPKLRRAERTHVRKCGTNPNSSARNAPTSRSAERTQTRTRGTYSRSEVRYEPKLGPGEQTRGRKFDTNPNPDAEHTRPGGEWCLRRGLPVLPTG